MNDVEQQLARNEWRPVPPEWRNSILAAAARANAGAQKMEAVPWWRALLCLSPRVWAGFAGVWIILVIAQMTMPSVDIDGPTSAWVSSGNVAEAWQMQRQLVSELLPRFEHEEPARAVLPRRRSERHREDYFA